MYYHAQWLMIYSESLILVNAAKNGKQSDQILWTDERKHFLDLRIIHRVLPLPNPGFLNNLILT